MGQSILWLIPTNLNPNLTYTIQIFSSAVESPANGFAGYNQINTISAGSGNTVYQYYDPNGSYNLFYYVQYVGSDGSIVGPVLAVLALLPTQLRLAQQIQSKLPEIIVARLDTFNIGISQALNNSIAVVNAKSPVTAYTFTNLPARYETPIVLLSMCLLYMEHQLQVSIRDYTYGGTGINLAVDRNSRFAATLMELSKQINALLDFIKQADWPTGPSGLGTYDLSVFQGRVFGILFGN